MRERLAGAIWVQTTSAMTPSGHQTSLLGYTRFQSSNKHGLRTYVSDTG